MTKILDPLNAKSKFVKSLTHQEEIFPDDDFLKPDTTRKIVRIIVIEEQEDVPSEKSDSPQDDNTVSELQKLISKQDLQNLLMFLRSQKESSSSETDTCPEWAKLTVASSNPNLKPRVEYY